MSEHKNPPTPQPPSVLESATALLGALSDLAPSQLKSMGPAMNEHARALRMAVARIDTRGYEPHVRAAEEWLDLAYSQPPEPARSTAPLYSRANMVAAFATGLATQLPSRPFTTETEALALEGIALMKRHAPPGELTAAHVTAVVDLAAAAFEISRGQSIRWEADMRAIRRWQAGEPDAAIGVLVDAAERLLSAMVREGEAMTEGTEAYAAALKDQNEAAGALLSAIAAVPRYVARRDRALVWPDHADLTVWLLWLLGRRPNLPALNEVHELASQVGRAGLWHASQGATHGHSIDGGELAQVLRDLSAAVIAADRRAFIAEMAAGGEKTPWKCAARRDPERDACSWPMCGCDPYASEVIDSLEEQGVVKPPRLALVSGCEESILGDAGRGSMEQSHAGDGDGGWLVERAERDGVIADGVIWQEPGEGGRIMAEGLARLTGLPIKTRTRPAGENEGKGE